LDHRPVAREVSYCYQPSKRPVIVSSCRSDDQSRCRQCRTTAVRRWLRSTAGREMPLRGCNGGQEQPMSSVVMSSKKCEIFVVMVANACASLFGCGDRARSGALPNNHASRSRPAKGLTAHTYDFGLVRPNTRYVHRFSLQNHSSSPLTISRIKSSCNCVVATAGGKHLAPSHELELIVGYRAPPANVDDVKTVEVQFENPSAPAATFTLRAHVRSQLTVVPGALQLGRPDSTGTCEGSLTIHNIGGKEWTDVDGTVSDGWLTVETFPIPVGKRPNPWSPRQVWRALVRADTTHLGVGKHRGSVRITVPTEDALVKSVPVDIEVDPPYSVFPSELFFPSNDGGGTATESFTIRFSADAAPRDRHRVQVLASPEGSVCTSLVRLSETIWRVSVRLMTVEENKPMEGTVTVAVRGRGDSETRIAVPFQIFGK